MRVARLLALLGTSAFCVTAAACSASKTDGGSLLSTGHGSDSGNGGDDTGFVLSDDAGDLDTGFNVGGSGNDASTGSDAACAGTKVKAQLVPLDLMIMQDQSGSMSDTVAGGGTKWQAVTGAIGDFVTQPGLDGISVGIQYFGLPPGGGTTASCSVFFCSTNGDCGSTACGPCSGGICTGALASSGGDSCNAADYAKPEVEIAALPGVASAIKSSLAKHSPSTSTPTSAALQGAIDHAKAWATAHPDHKVAVVIATDGEPTECDTDTTHIANIAGTAHSGTPSITTFAIGVFASADIPAGPNLLDAIAAAGGSSKSFTINTGSGNVAQSFLDALNTIRGSQLGCEYQIPANSNNDYGQVNVVFTPSSGAPQYLGYVNGAAACGAAGGWYYDIDPKVGTPTKIELCPSSCTTAKAAQNASIDIEIGCKTVIQ